MSICSWLRLVIAQHRDITVCTVLVCVELQLSDTVMRIPHDHSRSITKTLAARPTLLALALSAQMRQQLQQRQQLQ